ncbi:Uncharacterized protein HZ326_18892 [Fusarium oxysporum f. sp. albedinis]|nr:Uncharacterized protein HZ326_18892 [Fusarium oxysporum f. sp. albedinis]
MSLRDEEDQGRECRLHISYLALIFRKNLECFCRTLAVLAHPPRTARFIAMPKTQPGYFFVFLTGSVICTEHGTTLLLAPQYTTESFYSTGQGTTVQSGISSQHNARLLQEFPNVRAKHI